MDVDFHYAAVFVLAESAGFDAKEAEIIAYASQYVDDATESEPLHIQNPPPEADDQHINGRFVPVCTAHAGWGYLACSDKHVRRTVLLPFHFVPFGPSGGEFDYRVRAGGPLATAVLDDALQQLARARRHHLDPTRSLIKAGIALHAFADTWAHQGFSARHSAGDNDIQARERFENGAFQPLGVLEQAALDVLPDIGHVEAGKLPDMGFLRWRFKRAGSREYIERDNPSEFMAAAAAIHARLAQVTRSITRFPEALVRRCIEERADPFQAWCDTFGFPLKYDKLAWRHAALSGDRVDWDDWSALEFASKTYRYGGDPKWFLFHSEAGKQSDLLLRGVRHDLD